MDNLKANKTSCDWCHHCKTLCLSADPPLVVKQFADSVDLGIKTAGNQTLCNLVLTVLVQESGVSVI